MPVCCIQANICQLVLVQEVLLTVYSHAIAKANGMNKAGLEISENRHLPCITKNIGIYVSLEISKFSLALQPEALVNTSGQVLFSSPARKYSLLVVVM